MPLTPPKLDARNFEELFEEARSRIPQYLPEWTDWNESDPGITLLQLQAWLTETILYRLNQLPDLNYIKFLQLLGIEQLAERPAQAELTFTLREGDDVEVLIPRRTLVSVSDQDLTEPLSFETDRSLIAISARLSRLVQVDETAGEALDVTADNDFTGRTFTPFGDPATPGSALLFGFTSPLRFSREEIGLQVYLADEGQRLLDPAPTVDCQPALEESNTPRVTWQWWDGSNWDNLDVTGDDPRALTQSGQVYFRVPGQIPTVPAHRIGLGPTAASPQLSDIAELTGVQLGALEAGGINSVSQLAQLDIEQLAAALSLDPEADSALLERVLEDAQRLRDRLPPLYYWLRVVFSGGQYSTVPRVDRVLTNTVQATAAQTVFDEAVGSSDATPNQVMKLRFRPILADPPLQLEVDEAGTFSEWTEVSDFLKSRPGDTHFVLNRNTGEISFGDGRRGRIPSAGQFNVVARRYRYGGGRIGNVGSETITGLDTPIIGVESVTNVRPAVGGADEEPLAETMLRAPRQLKSRDRAVTLEDFALLAKETPGALVARATAYADNAERGPTVDVPCDESRDEYEACPTPLIQVVIVPLSPQSRPVPTRSQLRRVCRYLDQRRLVTTRVDVRGPRYQDLQVLANVSVQDDFDLRDVKNTLTARLQEYFHPLQGGVDGEGWPFGEPIYYSTLLGEMMDIEGVVKVQHLRMRKLLARFDEEAEALAELDGLLAIEIEQFGASCFPDGEVVMVVEPPLHPEDPPRPAFFVSAVYECCDLPIGSGDLIALHETEISVSYLRRRA